MSRGFIGVDAGLRRLWACLFVALYACGSIEEASPADPLHDVEREWKLFLETTYREPSERGVFIVEGDVPIRDERELRQYFDARVSSASRSLTVVHVMGADVIWQGSSAMNLTYCVSDDFGALKGDVVDGLELAARSWSDWVGVGFKYLAGQDSNCVPSNGSVVFDVRPAPPAATYYAAAFYPDYHRASRTLFIADSAFTTTAGGRDFEGILRHELGHVVGFEHEQIWLRDPLCFGYTHEARLVTDYDVDSVMHYPQCRPVNAGGYRQSGRDYAGAMSLYGLAPALIVSALP